MGLQIDTFSWDSLFAALGGNDAQRAERKMVQAASRRLYKETESNIKTKFPNAANTNPNYSDRVIDGLRMYVMKNDEAAAQSVVHIMGTRAKQSQTYKLRFYENGTNDRYTTSGAYRGRIKPLSFFGDAVSTVEPQVTQIMQGELNKFIDKLNGN